MAGHWYSVDGSLYGSVPTQKGGLRDFDLRDARKNGALPSVTTILGLLAKPGLVRWQVEQGIRAALDTAIMEPETTGVLLAMDERALYKELVHKAEEYTNWTADFGTAVHWWLNKKLRAAETIEIPPMIPGAEEVADALIEWFPANGYEWEKTEHHFARRDLGYGGSVDLIGTHYGKPCVADLKTQEPPLVPWPEFPLQLAGYDYALPISQDWHDGQSGDLVLIDRPRERISLIANRLKPGEVKEHIWIDKDSTIEATNARYNAIWLSLVSLWQGINQYVPGEVTNAP